MADKFLNFIGIRIVQDSPITFKATNIFANFLCKMAVKQGEFVTIKDFTYTLNK